MTALLAAPRSSCVAIAMTEFFRIICPVLYRPLTDGDCQERTTLSAYLCPSSNEANCGGKEVDLMDETRPSQECVSRPSAASRSEPSAMKWGSTTAMACPRSTPEEKRGDRHVHDTTQEFQNRSHHTRD